MQKKNFFQSIWRNAIAISLVTTLVITGIFSVFAQVLLPRTADAETNADDVTAQIQTIVKTKIAQIAEAYGEKDTVSDLVAMSLVRAEQSFNKERYVSETTEALIQSLNSDKMKITDVERMVMGLTACGYDVNTIQNAQGKTPIEVILNHDMVQGPNAKIYALLALDSGSYPARNKLGGSSEEETGDGTDEMPLWTREKLVADILSLKLPDGGWALSGKQSDVDVTAMALTALSPYKENPLVLQAIEDGFAFFKRSQNMLTGGFASLNSTGRDNSNSLAVVLLAYTAMGNARQSADDIKDVKRLLDALQKYEEEDGYAYLKKDGKNEMATEQAFAALVSLQLYCKQYEAKTGETVKRFYDFTDSQTTKEANIYIMSRGKVALPWTSVAVDNFDLTEYGAEANTEYVSAMHVLVRALEENGLLAQSELSFLYGGYVSAIDGVEGWTMETPKGGWLYTINDMDPGEGLLDYKLQDHDSIVLYCVDDYETWHYNYFTPVQVSEKGPRGSAVLSNTYVCGKAEEMQFQFYHIPGYGAAAETLANTELYVEQYDTNTKTYTQGKALTDQGKTVVTNQDGIFSFVFSEPGIYRVYANSVLADEIEPTAHVTETPGVSGEDTEPATEEPEIVFVKNYVSVVVTAPVLQPEPVAFTDVEEACWYIANIQALSGAGVIQGYKIEGSDPVQYEFRPNASITRAEFVKILVTAYGIFDNKAVSGQFTDVKKEDWFYTYVSSAANAALAFGISETEFGPQENLTREQMMTFDARVLVAYEKYALPETAAAEAALDQFTDGNAVSGYAKQAVAFHIAQGIVSGYVVDGQAELHPGATITRAEVATIICNVGKLNF